MGCFLVRDTFAGEGIHDFELNFHIHPEAVLASENDWWLVEQDGERIYMKLLTEEKPPFGWFSPAYGLKAKSGVLTCSRRGEPGNVSFLTAIWLGFPDEPEILRQRIDSWCTAG